MSSLRTKSSAQLTQPIHTTSLCQTFIEHPIGDQCLMAFQHSALLVEPVRSAACSSNAPCSPLVRPALTARETCRVPCDFHESQSCEISHTSLSKCLPPC